MTEEVREQKKAQLLDLSEKISTLKIKLMEAKHVLQTNFTVYGKHQSNWSPEQFAEEFLDNIKEVRGFRKELSETRDQHNKLYFELGGVRGAKKCQLRLHEEPEADQKTEVKTDKPTSAEERLDVNGFLSMSEAKLLFNSLYNFIMSKKDDDLFEVNVKVDGSDFFVTPVKEQA